MYIILEGLGTWAMLYVASKTLEFSNNTNTNK